MATDAAKKMEGAGKKRKKSQKDGKSKKSKQGEANLKSAQDKHVKQLSAGASGRPIFIQPPLLANGCVLKDYQLEGVRYESICYRIFYVTFTLTDFFPLEFSHTDGLLLYLKMVFLVFLLTKWDWVRLSRLLQ